MPYDIKTKPIGPHEIHVTWKKAAGPVTGYRVYCCPDDSQQAETMTEVPDVDQESVIISGLKPNHIYRVAIASVTSKARSKLVFSSKHVRMGNRSQNTFLLKMHIIDIIIVYIYISMVYVSVLSVLFYASAGLHFLVFDQNLIALKQQLNLEPVLKRMLKDSSAEKDIMSGEVNEQRIQRFTEWLQWRNPEDYKNFIEILYKTDQSQVATHLLKSCRCKANKLVLY